MYYCVVHVLAYRSDLGANHRLTKDVRKRIRKIKAQLAAKRHYVPPSTPGWQIVLQNWFPWLETLLNREEIIKETFEEEEEEEEGKETEFGESRSEKYHLNRLSHDQKGRKENKAPQPGWGQWLGSLLRRAPASTAEKAEERRSKPLLTEAEEHPPQAGWGQWFSNLFKRTPAHIEGKEGEDSRLPAEEEEDDEVPLQPTWSYQLMNVWSRSQISSVSDGSDISHMEKEEGQSQTSLGQRLGALWGRRTTGQDRETKVSPVSSQSQHV